MKKLLLITYVLLLISCNSSGPKKDSRKGDPGRNIKEYKIQRETSTRDVFVTIGTVSFNNAGSFLDKSSIPEKHAGRYRLETINDNGYSYGFSNVHQTIHLAVSQGNPNYYNLTWTPYLGFNFGTYYVYRGKTADKLTLIDSISANQTQCTDKYSGKAYYRIGIRSNYPCSPDSVLYFKSLAFGSNLPEEFTLSNMESMYVTDINENSIDFHISPNPYEEQFTISADINNSVVNVDIYNALGEKIYSYKTKQSVSGHFEHIINSADLLGATKVCIVKIKAGDRSGISKLIKR